MRSTFVPCLFCLAFLVMAAMPTQATESSRPNILVIVADDLGYADLGVQGCKDIPTPHLDALCKSGVRCTNGYVSGPYCSPTRAGLLARATVAPFRVNYHMEHHLLIAVPYFQLPKMHRMLRERGVVQAPPGYAGVIALVSIASAANCSWTLGSCIDLFTTALMSSTIRGERPAGPESPYQVRTTSSG